MTGGPHPWQQTSWDARAAGNFICGGAGGGLIVFAAASGARGAALAVLLVLGTALVAGGLACVWLELGRPLRAINVLRNPRRSWMTREALAATLLFVLAALTVAGVRSLAWPAALAALAFVYCQGRLLQGAKGIPAWRAPLVPAFIVATALAEGGGVFWLAGAYHLTGTVALLGAFGLVLIVRYAVWLAYRRSVAPGVAPPTLAALDAAGRALAWIGTALPLVLIAVAGTRFVGQATLLPLVAVAGLCALSAGAWFKYALVTRAGFNQGFALAQLPVRGARP